MRVLFVVLAALALAGAAEALITTNPTRFDLPDTSGAVELAGDLVVRNRGTEATVVTIVAEALEAEVVLVDPQSFRLEPSEERTVRIRVGLAANASGGRHDVRLSFLERPVLASGAAQGQSGVLVPFVFTVDNLKLGGLTVADVAQGEEAQAHALVQNFLRSSATPAVRLLLLDAGGAEVAETTASVPSTERNATMPLSSPLPTGSLPAGVYWLRATAILGDRESNSVTIPLLIGDKRLTLSGVSASADGTGRVALNTTIDNPGTVPLTAIVTFRLVDPAGRLIRAVDSEAVAVAPGERAGANATTIVPPGAYRVDASVGWRGGSSNATGPAISVAAPQPAQPAPAWVIPAVAVVAAAGGGYLLWRRWR